LSPNGKDLGLHPKKTEIINDKNKKNCEIELQLSINRDGTTTEYVIKRGISPSYCQLLVDGEDKTKCPKCEKECKKFISISNFKINGYSYANGYSKGAKTKHDKVD
jgi:hypothetical protein